jgi:hypothetical protein
MDLAPFPNISGAVAKASTGHFPLPFLISDLKNWCKDRGISYKSTIFVDFSFFIPLPDKDKGTFFLQKFTQDESAVG